MPPLESALTPEDRHLLKELPFKAILAAAIRIFAERGVWLAPTSAISRAAGVAELAGWRFIITKRGTANIVKAAGGRVYGTLWHCLPSHLEMLDRYEAVRLRVYRRRTVVVQLADGRTRHAIVYVSSLHQRGRARREYLKTAVLPGAHAFRLPPDYIDEIARWLPPGRIGAAKPRYRGRRH